MSVGWEQVGRESQGEVLLRRRPTLCMFAICSAIFMANLKTSEVTRKAMLDSTLLVFTQQHIDL